MKAYRATVTVVIRPNAQGVIDKDSACEWFGGLLSDHPEVYDWGYARYDDPNRPSDHDRLVDFYVDEVEVPGNPDDYVPGDAVSLPPSAVVWLADAAEAVLDSECGVQSLSELAVALHALYPQRDWRAEYPGMQTPRIAWPAPGSMRCANCGERVRGSLDAMRGFVHESGAVACRARSVAQAERDRKVEALLDAAEDVLDMECETTNLSGRLAEALYALDPQRDYRWLFCAGKEGVAP